jgi:hypothetical protein
MVIVMNTITDYAIAGWFFTAAAVSAAPCPSADVRADLQFPLRGACPLDIPSPLEGEGRVGGLGGLDKSSPYTSIPSPRGGEGKVDGPGGLDKSSPYTSIPSPLRGACLLDIPSPLRGEGQGEGCFAKEGRIVDGHSLVWGENTGWVNLKAQHGDLRIGSNVLAGWIWLESCGWVCAGDGAPLDNRRYSNRSAYDWGVNNDGRGNLSGYAWSEVTGWLNFGTSHSHVCLDEKGQFRGYAWGENVGWIRFGPGGRVKYLAKASPGPWKEIGTEAERRLAGNGTEGESYVRSGRVPVCGLNHGSERYDEHAGVLCAGVVDGSDEYGHLRLFDKPVCIDYEKGNDYIRGPPRISQHSLSPWWERAG